MGLDKGNFGIFNFFFVSLGLILLDVLGFGPNLNAFYGPFVK